MSNTISIYSKYIEEEQKKISLAKVDITDTDDTSPYIHFRHIALSKDPKEKKDKKVITNEEFGDDLPHERMPDLEWRNHNENTHLGKTSKAINAVLKKASPNLGHLKRDVTDYTGKTSGEGSSVINNALLNPKKSMGWRTHGMAKRLHKATSQPIGHDVNLYSGVHSDPRKWEKSDDGSTRLRAFTSMTHDKKIAHIFAHQWTEGKKASTSGKKGQVHIIHLHAKATDHGLHVSHHSSFNEHETVLPADTHIKPHPDFKGPEVHVASDGTKVHIHHFVIHRQTPTDNYKPENRIS